MNLSYIVNPQDLRGKVLVDAVAQENRQAVNNGTAIDISGIDCIVIKIYGTFVGNVQFNAKHTGDASVTNVTRYVRKIENGLYPETNNNIPIDLPNAGGTVVYFYVNSNRYDQIYVRLNSYTSGAMSATVSSANIEEIVRRFSRQICIKAATGISVEANSNSKLLENYNCEDFAFVYATVRCDSAHTYTVGLTFRGPSETLGVNQAEQTIIIDGLQRDTTDWLDVKGTMLTFRIVNADSNAHTYDLYLYGVR